MKIHKHDLDAEDRRFSGEWADLTLLGEEEGVFRQIGPVAYVLDIRLEGTGVLLSGKIGVEVELECVRCLSSFRHKLIVPNFLVHLEWAGRGLLDLSGVFREDLLLALPDYPDCAEDGGLVCPGPPAEEKSSRKGSVAIPEPVSPPDPWQALDELKL